MANHPNVNHALLQNFQLWNLGQVQQPQQVQPQQVQPRQQHFTQAKKDLLHKVARAFPDEIKLLQFRQTLADALEIPYENLYGWLRYHYQVN